MIFDQLPNGLKLAIKENHFAKAVSLQCWVGVGSLDETPEQRGMAHVIEHMLFKGTEKRAAGEMGRIVEACGGDMNAYTTFDRTVYHMSLASEFSDLGVELLGDALFHSNFDEEELSREIEVILEEIRHAHDDPAIKVGRKVFENFYRGSEAERPVIGFEEIVKSFNQQKLIDFFKNWYVPNNMHFVAVGDFSSDKIIETIEKHFGQEPQQTLPKRMPLPTHSLDSESRAILLKDDYQLPRIEVIFPASRLEDFDTASLDVASFVLGSGEAARLVQRLRNEKAVVAAVNSSVYTPAFPGIFSVTARATEKELLRAVSGIACELKKIIGSEPVSEEELKRAQTNLRADRVYRDETVEGQARSLGFGIQTSHQIYFDDVYQTIVDKLTPEVVSSQLRKWLDPSKALVVALVNENSELKQQDLKDAFDRNFSWSSDENSSLKKQYAPRSTKETIKSQDIQVTELKPGIKFIYKQNTDGELFSLCAATAGGQRAESQKTSGLYHLLASLSATATSEHDNQSFAELIESTGGGLSGFSGKDSFGFNLSCLSQDMETFIGLFSEALLDPVYTEDQWQASLRESLETLNAQKDSAASICVREFQKALYGEHPYSASLFGSVDSLNSFKKDEMTRLYKDFRDSGEWIISAVGPQSFEDVADLLKTTLQEFQPSSKKRHFKYEESRYVIPKEEIFLKKDREQLHIVLGFNGMSWVDEDRYSLDVLINILAGHGGRMFYELREKMGIAYTVTPLMAYGCDPGFIGSYLACSPDKKQKALTAMKAEFEKLTETLVSPEELARAKKYIVGNHEMSLQKTDSQSATMALMELYGLGYSEFLNYHKKIEAVSADQIKKVACRMFKNEAPLVVCVGPEA